MVTPVRPLSGPPDTNDPANFDARADLLFQTDLPNLVMDFNANVNELNELSEAAPIAIAAANYQGEYDPMVTYLKGQSVSYLGRRFAAKKNNLGITPVDGPDWLLITIDAATIIVSQKSDNATYPLMFASSAVEGSQLAHVDGSGGTYNPSTNTAAMNITGSAATATTAATATSSITSETAVSLLGQRLQFFQANGSFVVPSNVTKVRGYAVGKGGNSTSQTATGTVGSAGGGGGGFAFGDINVTPGQTITVTINATSTTVAIGATTFLTANAGQNGSNASGGTGGTASINAAVTNGNAFSGGSAAGLIGSGGASSGSPLGAGTSGGVSDGGGGGGIGGSGASTGGGGGGAGGSGDNSRPSPRIGGSGGGAGGNASVTPGGSRVVRFTDTLLNFFDANHAGAAPGGSGNVGEGLIASAAESGGGGGGFYGTNTSYGIERGGNGGFGGGGGGAFFDATPSSTVNGGIGGTLGGGGAAAAGNASSNSPQTAIGGNGGLGGGAGGGIARAGTATGTFTGGTGGSGAVWIFF